MIVSDLTPVVTEDCLPRRGRWPAGPEGDSVSQRENCHYDKHRVPLRPSGTSPCGGGNPGCVHAVAILWERRSNQAGFRKSGFRAP